MKSTLAYVATTSKCSKYLKAILAAVLIGSAASYYARGAFSPVGTPHDFLSSGWSRGTMCSPCHAPQGGWNHRLSTRTYIISNSPTLDAADLGQPSGTSARCLSCHDRTVALDSFGGVTGRTYISPAAQLGPDLRSHHPVSFTYDLALAIRDGALRNPATAPSGLGGTVAQDMLVGGKLECTSCHDEHGTSLRIPLAGRALCETCHLDASNTAGHHMPGRSDPWNNCTLCHGPTLGGGAGPACTACHNDFLPPDPPAAGHNLHPGHTGFGIDDRLDPFSNCILCHGGDLGGGTGPSCFTCHDQMWPDPPDQPPVVDPPVSGHHMPGRDDPWNNCTACHGQDLMGDPAFGTPACTACHNDFLPPDPPAAGHNLHPGHTGFGIDDRLDPFSNCILCHGGDLGGGIGPSCFTCHGQKWPDAPPENLPPLADPNGPYTGIAGDPVQFDGAGSVDDVAITSYEWSFGDGSTGSGASPTHTYAGPGHYTVTLTVRDAGGLADTATTTADISANVPPLADSGGPYTDSVGGIVLFDGSGSMDLDGVIISYDWDFGDGNTGSGVAPTHTYTAGGTFTVTLTVTDDGGLTDTVTTTADVAANLPPIVVTGGPYEGLVGEPVDFDLSGTTDPEGDDLIFLWMDWGDGSPPGFPPPFGPQASHTYADPGEYTVVFSVTDGHHTPTTHQIQVTITDGPPPPTGNTWAVQIPFLFTEFTVKFQDLGGMYFVETTYPDGQIVAGIGMESGGVILWMNLTGTIYFGNVDRQAGRMSGIVFDSHGSGSIWFAERL